MRTMSLGLLLLAGICASAGAAAPVDGTAPALEKKALDTAAPAQDKNIPGLDKKADGIAPGEGSQTGNNVPDPKETPGAPQGKGGQPPEETPSGTKPAEPAVPGETPAQPAEPGKPEPKSKDKPGKRKGGRGGSGGGSLPSALPAAAAAPLAVPAILPGKDEDKQPKAEKSSGTVVSTSAVKEEPLYSAADGIAIAVLDFEGESGAEFAGLLSAQLATREKVYSRKAIQEKSYGSQVARLAARKIASETGTDYLVAGRISKKTESLSIISVILREGSSGDIKSTIFVNLRNTSELSSAAATAAGQVSSELGKLKK